MTAPPHRVSFGFHAFPFSGLTGRSGDDLAVPLLPVKFRPSSARWSPPLNAVVDTGSTHSLVPREVAEDIGLSNVGRPVTRGGAGGEFDAAPVACDLAIVDAHFPSVACWELEGFIVWVPVREDALTVPVLGWDLLKMFDLSLSYSTRLIQMRHARGPRQPSRAAR